MRIATVAVLILLGSIACEREPAIVIRFDPVDLAGRDLSHPARDAAAASRDAAVATSDAAVAVAPTGSKAAPGGKAAPGKAEACARDADCVIVPDGCCGCANGGKQRAVLKRDEERLVRAQRQSCKEVLCTMMISTDPTCGKRAACVGGACALRDARPDETKKSRVPAPQ